jgi:hypothetical protein
MISSFQPNDPQAQRLFSPFTNNISSVVGYVPFSGAVAKLRKALLSSCLSIRMEKLGSHWTDFDKI